MLFRAYLTDCLYFYPRGSALTERYCNLAIKKPVKEDERSADEIVKDVMEKAGLRLV